MLRALLASLRRRPLKVWFHPAFRLPLSGTEASTAMDLRRANHAVHYLLQQQAVPPEGVITPQPVSYEELGRVHTPDWLESLSRASTLAHVFAVDEADVVVDELLASVRLACGATVEAARCALELGHPTLNLLGGFHHAAPSQGVGFCAVNDVAVAIAALRAGGFAGRVAVIDLDAHPPDGTAACLLGDGAVWHASLSGVSWGELPGVDDVVLARGAGDAEYLAALDALLGRMPPCALAFVIAGGDVLAGDRLGGLGLSVAGARVRDLRVARHLSGTPSVWLPGGGYGPHAWKVLAGTGLALAFDTDAPIPPDFDPLGAELADVAHDLKGEQLGSELSLSEADFPELYGGPAKGSERLLGFYTREGLEYALERYGILPFVRRLGFTELRVELGGSRLRLGSREGALLELEVDRQLLEGRPVLFVNWLSLRNPKAHFSQKRPRLPGQQVPGLGLSHEASVLLAIMAERLKLEGVAFRPSWYHMAYAARHAARFVDPARQGRFEALVRDLRGLTLLEATGAVASGRTRLNAEPYTWEADVMVRWLKAPAQGALGERADAERVAAERERCRFTVV